MVNGNSEYGVNSDAGGSIYLQALVDMRNKFERDYAELEKKTSVACYLPIGGWYNNEMKSINEKISKYKLQFSIDSLIV